MKEKEQLTPPEAQAKIKKVDTNVLSSQETVALEQTVGSDRYPDVYMDYRPAPVSKVDRQAYHQFQFSCTNSIQLRIEVYSSTIFRLRYSLKKEFPADFSYAIDESFSAQKTAIEFEPQSKYFRIATPALNCLVSKADLKVTFTDKSGTVINADDDGFYARSTILEGIQNIQISKTSPKGEAYFGLGDKSGNLNLRGQKLQNWNTDAFAYDAKSDPLYKAIPFYYGLNKGQAYGIFFDNSYRTHFEFDYKKSGQTVFAAEGGEINYYFIYGPELDSVAKQYTDITGKAKMPPIWALGFHQCRWSYFPDARVMEVAKEFRTRQIPCDALYLDIDYMDGYRCFTWDKDLFPKPAQMIKNLEEQGFKTIVMIDPGLKVDEAYSVYKEGKDRDYYCKRPDGETMEGPVWPPECVWPDYTRPDVRGWWGHQYAELYSKHRVAGFWNDMNEPAVFKVNSKTFPENVRHSYDGHPCSHAKAHNIYGFNMARATQEGLLKLKEHRRPFVITRATFSGGQRHACVWTGDNVASWEHLQIANRQCQRLSISGFSFTGSDIGGFVDRPTGELLVRWLQLGVFHPLYRIHSMGNNTDGANEVNAEFVKEQERINRLDQEPWSFGEDTEEMAKYAIELRYQMLPYVYTTFWNYVQTGQPMLRSLIFEDQSDENLIKIEREFLFGDHLIVSPVVREKAKSQEVYLPKGTWYNYWTAAPLQGQKKHRIKTPLHQIPMFVRAGAVIPHYPIMQSTQERPVDELMLHVFYGTGETNSQLYEDQGDGFEYKEGAYSLKEFTLLGKADSLQLEQKKSGNQYDSYLKTNVFLYGLPFEPKSCEVDGASVKFNMSSRKGHSICVVNCPSTFQNLVLKS
jgi:alpha-glucosidase